MPHRLLKNQNDPSLTKLLHASSAAYSEAKRKEYLYTYFYIGLGILYVVVYLFLKDEVIKHSLFGVSFFLTVTLWWYADKFKGNTLKGAYFKEMYDVRLFDIDPKFLQKEPKDLYLDKYADKYKDLPITNWYPDEISENLSKEQAIALCQYIGSYWDVSLREKYLKLLEYFFWIYIAIVVILLIVIWPDRKTIFLLLFSLLSFFSHFITLIKGNRNTIKKREELLVDLNELIKKRHPFTRAELRDIQDIIFTQRLEPSKVHKFFYKKYNPAIRNKCNEYITEVNKIYDNPMLTVR